MIDKNKIMVLGLIAVVMVGLANATTISGVISSFTGTLSVTPVDASTGLTIDQNYNAIALDLDSEATSAAIIRATGLTNTVVLGHPTSANGANYFYRDDVAANTNGAVMFIKQDNVGDNQDVLSIQNDGTGASIGLTSAGAGMEMKSPDGTTYCLTIANGGTTNVAVGACTK